MNDVDEVEDWQKKETLGNGGFGIVVLWQHKGTGKQIALKQCKWGNDPMMTPKHKHRWDLEVQIMKRLNHPNVVKALEVPDPLQVSATEMPVLSMEYCSKGDLRKVLNKGESCCGLSELEVRSLASDIAAAVEYLHSVRIIHRDLKPENIVLQDVDRKIVYKLIDLGYAKEVDQGSVCTSFVGTLQYLAPELFLTQEYSGTVDYWSLGLVIHESITGIRPFLPTMAPAQWMQYVGKKGAEDICAYVDQGGKVQFSSQLFPENHLSKPLIAYMEKWLQVMLQWDPHKRGMALNQENEKEVIAFSMLKSILQKKIIHVFSVATWQSCYYEVDENVSMQNLLEKLECDTKIKPENIELLLPRGMPPDMTTNAIKYWAEPEEEEWLLYAFPADSLSSFPEIRPVTPALVEKMMREFRIPCKYEDQRRMWAHAVYFVSHEYQLYQKLLQAHKVLMTHLLYKNSQMHKTTMKMTTEMKKVRAKYDLFLESINFDKQNYENQAKNGGLTSDNLGNSVKCDEISRKITKLQEEVNFNENKSIGINTKTVDLQRSPYYRSKQNDTMSPVYKSAIKAYEELQNRSTEERRKLSDNAEIMNIIITCLKTRDANLKNFFSQLNKIIACKKDVLQLLDPLKAILQKISSLSDEISLQQRNRQAIIWKAVNHLVKSVNSKQANNGHIPTPSMLDRSLYLRSSPKGFFDNRGSPLSLSNIICQATEESHLVIQQSQETCQKLEDEVSSLNLSFPTPLDWSFLSDSSQS